MPNQPISRIFVFFFIVANMISCSGADTVTVQPEIVEPQNESGTANQSDAKVDIEIAEQPAAQSPISAAFTGADPAVSDIEFIAELNVEMPSEMPIYKSASIDFDQTKALGVAQQFGMGDQLFVDKHSGNTSFYAFKDGNQLQIFPGQVQFTNTAVQHVDQATFSADEVVSHVEDILSAWEWPRFDYKVLPISSSSAEIRRVINGEPVSFADMSIQIGATGELSSFSLFMPESAPAEMGPIISAEEALNKLALTTFEEAGVRYEVGASQVPEFQMIQPTTPSSWRNRYPAGSKVNLTGVVTEFLPTNGSDDSALFLDRFKLDGAADMLDSLRQHGAELVTVSGTISADGNILQIDIWSAADLSNTDSTAPLTGVIRLEEGKAFLDNSRLGNGYLLINPPGDIQPESEVVVYQNFYFSNADGRFIEWNLVELQNPSIPQPPSNIAGTAELIMEGANRFTVDRMKIAYGRPVTGSDPSIVYAPVWRIYGSTDSGLSVVFDVPALK